MRSAFHAAFTAILAASVFIQPEKAETVTPRQTLESLFTADRVDTGRFAAGFLAKVPAAQLTQIVAGLKRDFGRLIGVDAAGSGFVLRFERARIPARISLDPDGRVIGLWFGAAQAEGDIDSLVAAIKALPGRTSLLVTTDGKPVAAHEAAAPLAVGSAAKLAVLLALKRAVSQQHLGWDTVVKLDPHWKSLPSSLLQDWPEATPLTVATLAHLMISVSDNTATDALIRILGREVVESASPRNTPFLTTHEFFTLKTSESAPLRVEWQNGDATRRRAILDRISGAALPSPAAISPTATPDIEWFMTAQELCALLEATADLPSVGINSGPVDRKYWRSVAYKGGSETGVLNLSSLLTGKDGSTHCVVATWNGDGPLDENKLIAPYLGIVGRLAMRRN
jgi:beta-lactamase class A